MRLESLSYQTISFCLYVAVAKSAFGCESHNISLSCPENKTIFVDRADYGEYQKECPENTCCLPYPPDCTELVSENNPAEWVSLKAQCDNTSSCSYLFRGGIFIDECGASEEVDYMNICYPCLPGQNISTYILKIIDKILISEYMLKPYHFTIDIISAHFYLCIIFIVHINIFI